MIDTLQVVSLRYENKHRHVFIRNAAATTYLSRRTLFTVAQNNSHESAHNTGK